MKKTLLFAAFAAAALVSCSKDQVVDVHKDEIKFSVVTDNATKATNLYCANNMHNQFTLWATYATLDTDNDNLADAGIKPYIINDNIKYSTETSKWVNTAGNRYWPDAAEVDFYAVTGLNDASQFTMTTDESGYITGAKIVDFQVAGPVKNQVDLMYATSYDLNKADNGDDDVKLNFRHALSQVVFKAKNTNENLYIEIDGVAVNNVKSKGTYVFSNSDDTHFNWVNHSESGNTDDLGYNSNDIGEYINSLGTWESIVDGMTTTFGVDFETTIQVPFGGVTNLTDRSSTHNNSNINAENVMLMIPQDLTAWDPTSAPAPFADGNDGTFFTLACKIYNVVDKNQPLRNNDGSLNMNNLVLVWGDVTNNAEGTGVAHVSKQIAVPTPGTKWVEGRKYEYTFVFDTNTNGGWDPNPGPGTTDPKPALVPIKLEVTVDDFMLKHSFSNLFK